MLLDKLKKMACLMGVAFIMGIVFPNSVGAVLSRGCVDREVKRIQTELLRRGYLITDLDGEFGPQTEAAVRLFQKQNELKVTGIVDGETLLALFARKEKYGGGYDKRLLEVIDAALDMLGTPYAFGGEGQGGIDCSAFTQKVYRSAGIFIPRTADLQYLSGKKLTLEQIRPGDLIFFTTYEPGASHCGVYLAGGKFVHASSSKGVIIANAFTGYWGDRYYGACRIIE